MVDIIIIAIHLIERTLKNIGFVKIAKHVTFDVRSQRTNNVVEGFHSKLGKFKQLRHTNMKVFGPKYSA